MLIEETGRELLGRILLSLYAAHAGIPSVIAPQWLVWETLEEIPKGVLLFKSNSAVQAANMAKAKAAGHLVASMEEEALGLCDAAQINRCYAPSVARSCDLFFFQGEFQRRCITEFLGPLQRSSVTGNPRIDFLTPRFNAKIRAESDRVKHRFGEFLLINSNFSTINPREFDACGVLETCLNAGWYDPTVPEDIEVFFAEAEREREDLKKSIRLIYELIDRGFRWPIVIRPHPAENLNIWERAFAAYDNVHVVRHGDHITWTAAARMLLHTSCTTGMEAFVLGTPAISLKSSEDEWTNIITSNLVNPTFTEIDNAILAIENHFNENTTLDFSHDDFRRELEKHLHIDDILPAGARIANSLAELLNERGRELESPPNFQAFRRAAPPDQSIDLSALEIDAVDVSMRELGSYLGHRGSPRLEEIAKGVVLCHPMAENGSSTIVEAP